MLNLQMLLVHKMRSLDSRAIISIVALSVWTFRRLVTTAEDKASEDKALEDKALEDVEDEGVVEGAVEAAEVPLPVVDEGVVVGGCPHFKGKELHSKTLLVT